MSTTEWTFDHLDDTLTAEQVRVAYRRMRESCPVAHSDQHGGYDFVNRYEDVNSVLADSTSFSSADGVSIPPSGLPPVPALEFDEPEHSAWRDVLDGPLAPQAVRGLEPAITEVVDLLIDDFAGTGSADLVPALTSPLPAIVIGRMIGLDHDTAVHASRVAAEMFASVGTPAFPEKAAVFFGLTRPWLEDRRLEPRDDVLTQMASGVVKGMEIDDDGVAGLMMAYVGGGTESTASGLAALLRHVLADPGLREDLVSDRRALPSVIEESLRLSPPLHLFARTVRCPVSIGGTDLPEGRRIMLNLAAANRDPHRFENPDTFNAKRRRNRHLTFGAGTHVCQGQHLARAELRIAVNRLLDRLPDVRLGGQPVETGLVRGNLMTLLSLPVVFTPEGRQ